MEKDIDINYRRKILDILVKTCKMNNLDARKVEMRFIIILLKMLVIIF